MRLAARMQNKQWAVKPVCERSAELARSLKVSPLSAQVLINRGITCAETGIRFLQPRLTDLIAPEKMSGIEKAVEKLKKAIKSKEKITIYGDYDVDGMTGVAILWQLITQLGGNVDYYIPHRIDEGYGLNPEAIEIIAAAGSKVLVTVDCGIGAIESISLAGRSGLDVIVTDHHQPGPELPDAFAIVHPVMDASYGNQDSAGAMVAFKLAWALANEFNSGVRLEPELRDFMLNATSLAAMGTIADIVDLRGENRILTHYGLKTLAQCSLSGIKALVESAGLNGAGLDTFDIGFRLAPMLNAAGRMGHARLAVELLTSKSDIRSAQIAEYLKDQNNHRRRCERKIFKQACEIIVARDLNHPDRKSIVLAEETWHSGVIGIVASRIVDKYYRPTIMLNCSGQIAQGSGRSIEGFDILAGLSDCADHLISFGGHKMAAGIKIEVDKIDQFADDFEAYAQENLNHDDITAKLDIDAEVRLADLNWDVVNELKMLEPFGRGNPEPVFATKGLRLACDPRRVGAKGDHLQLAVTDNTATIRCIGFGMGKLEKKLLESDFFNAAYRADLDTYNGNKNIQLVLTDIQFE